MTSLETPGDDEIRSTIVELWRAAGVDVEKTTLSGYIRDDKGDTVGCADLPADAERWVAYRTAGLIGDLYPQRQVFDSITAHLRDEGFEIKRYRDPMSGYLQLRAERDEFVVFLDVASNGWSHLDVQTGPCATFMGREPPDNTEPIP